MVETFYPVSSIYPCIRDTGTLAGVAMTSVCLIETYDEMMLSYEGMMTGARIAEHVREYAPSWVFVTGCEPTTHDLSELMINLMASKFSIALETDGSIYQDCMKCMDWITVSPKMQRSFEDIDSLVVGLAHEIKFVIPSVGDLSKAFDFVKRFHINPAYTICLQPADMSAELINLCYNAVITMGWRLAVPLNRLIAVN